MGKKQRQRQERENERYSQIEKYGQITADRNRDNEKCGLGLNGTKLLCLVNYRIYTFPVSAWRNDRIFNQILMEKQH